MSKNAGKEMNRRDVLRRLAVGALSAASIAGSAVGSETAAEDQACCESQSLPDQSVFNTVCNSDSATKYKDGDTPAVYRLGALWLMLATEDWKTYFNNPNDPASETAFLAGLAKELKLNSADVEKMWKIGKLKSKQFESIRTSWHDLTSNASVYGARPCHGGKSILTIACLDPNDESNRVLTKPAENKAKQGKNAKPK
jgi:hypothetical protein